jgi:hypothetical protein
VLCLRDVSSDVSTLWTSPLDRFVSGVEIFAVLLDPGPRVAGLGGHQGLEAGNVPLRREVLRSHLAGKRTSNTAPLRKCA